MKKKLLIFSIISTLVFSYTGPCVTYATSTPDNNINEVTENYASEKNWGMYSNDYYYNKMSTAQKALYTLYDRQCKAVLESDSNTGITYMPSVDMYTLDKINIANISMTEARDTFDLFRLSNPQYFFLSNAWLHLENNGYLSVWLVLYPSMADVNFRTTTKNKIWSKTQTWLKKVDKCKTKKEKIKKIHNLVVKQTDYDYKTAKSEKAMNNKYNMTQSIYGLFCTKKSICYGYAMTFSMMCNAAGITTIPVQSDSHVWNRVHYNNKWYNVDCTWDDNNNGSFTYDYFMISNKHLSNYDANSEHKVESWLKKYL